MEKGAGKGDAICVLSFDNGGPGTYSQLRILSEMMARLQHDLSLESKQTSEDRVAHPAAHFHLMGGVGFGGLAAILLGHLEWDIAKVINTVHEVAKAIFPEDRPPIHDPKQNLSNLERAIEKVLDDNNLPVDLRLIDDRKESPKCKVAIYATTLHDVKHFYSFRNYGQSLLNPTIVEAVCASIAIPTLFSPVRIESLTFVGGALGASNPTQMLLKEAIEAFDRPNQRTRIAQIISLGSGVPPILDVATANSPQGVCQMMQVMTVDSEILARELDLRLFRNDAYIRFNVDKGMEHVSIDDWSNLGEIANYTDEYISKPSVSRDIDGCLKRIRERIGTTTLWQLTHARNIIIAAKTAPPLSPHYVVREKEVNLMIHHLISGTSTQRKICVITGIKGTGKTQMVSYFLHATSRPPVYKYTVFVDAGSSASIKADLQAWVRSLGEGHEKENWEDALRILSGASQWVLVMDGANDATVQLVSFFPTSMTGTIIITSRNREVSNLAKTYHMDLGRMGRAEALVLLRKSARREDALSEDELKSATLLIHELGYFPDAIVRAGKYCHDLSATIRGEFQPYTFTQYLDLFYPVPGDA